MKQILLSATLVLWAFSAGAQTNTSVNSTCQLGLNKSPAVRGIRLGMKLDDLLRLFPRAEESEHVKPALQKKDSYPNFGIISFDIAPGWYPAIEQFRGIGILRFTFIDDRLADYTVEYSYPPDSPPWPRVEDWVTKVASSFDLPPTSDWTGAIGSERTLTCNGFQVRATINLSGRLRVATVELPYKEQQARRVAFEEKMRRDFKP